MHKSTLRNVAVAAAVLFFSAPGLAKADDAQPSAPPAADTPASSGKNAVGRDDTHGVVGTLSLLRPVQVGAAGSEGETNCAGLGSQCSADASKGGGFMFSVGYMWRYIGFDVLAGGTADGGERAYLPNRGIRQTYTVERLGGMAAVRLRGQVQSEDFRGTLALGPGVAYRVVGQSDGFPEVPKDGTTYGSFAFTADINGQWRMGQHTALVVGTMLWIESAGSEATTVRSKVLARATGSSEFHLVSGTQTMLMPYIGLQFGP